MISLDDVERIHEILIDKFGGKTGLRDKGLLESSIRRPFQTFDQKELYPEAVDKAAAVLYRTTLLSTAIKGPHM